MVTTHGKPDTAMLCSLFDGPGHAGQALEIVHQALDLYPLADGCTLADGALHALCTLRSRWTP